MMVAPSRPAAARRRDRPGGGGRSIFALPWLGRSLIGTTDNNYEGDIDHVRPPREDIEYLLDAVNAFFGTELGRGDLVGAYAGVRPLISSGDTRKSVDISRKAELYETSSGHDHDHRRQADDLAADGEAGRRSAGRARRARGAVPDARDPARRSRSIPTELPRVEGVAGSAYAALAARYGHAAERGARLAADEPGLARPIVAGQPDLLAEAAFAARTEQARDGRRRAAAAHAAGAAGGRASCARGRPGPPRVAEAIGASSAGTRRVARPRAGKVRRGGRGGGTSASAPQCRPGGMSVAAANQAGPADSASRPWLMGIVNATPDSFSDAGVHQTLDERVEFAPELLDDGAT